MEEYINKHNIIIDDFLESIFKISDYFISERMLELLNEKEINDLKCLNRNILKRIILKCIGIKTYEFIEKNVNNEYKHLPIEQLLSDSYKYLKEFNVDNGRNHINAFDWFTWYSGFYDREYNDITNKEEIIIYITSLRQLELTILDVMRSDTNNYFSLTSKDISNEIFKYL